MSILHLAEDENCGWVLAVTFVGLTCTNQLLQTSIREIICLDVILTISRGDINVALLQIGVQQLCNIFLWFALWSDAVGCHFPDHCNVQTEFMEENYLKQGRSNEYVG